MGLVSTWLNGIGLSSAVPTFQAAGIVTPAALAELDVAHFEALGVSDPDDRRKLFYLVQRIKMAVLKDRQQAGSVEQQVDAVINSTLPSSPPDSGDEEISNGDFEGGKETKEGDELLDEEQPDLRRSKRLAAKQLQPGSPRRSKENRSQNITTKSKQPSQRTTLTRRVESSTSDIRTSREENGDESSKDDEANSRLESLRSSKRLLERRISKSKEPDFKVDNNNLEPSATESSLREMDSSSTSRGIKKLSASLPKLTQSVSSLSDPESIESSESKSVAAASKLQVPKSRRPESRLQNPGKSNRTGKSLSSIPSESIAPMSPLSALPTSKFNEEPDDADESYPIDKKQDGRRRSRSGDADSLDQLLQSYSESESSLLAFSEVESEKGTDSEFSYLDNQRQKILGESGSSISKEKTRHISAPRSPVKESSSRSASTIGKTSGRKSFPATRGKASSMPNPAAFIHGGTEADSWRAKVGYLREDNDAEHELFCSQSSHDLYDYDMRIRVIVRKRPVSKSEANLSGGIDVIHPLDYGEYGRVLVYQPKTRVDLTKEIETIPFSFDNVFDERSTNAQIYERSVRNLIPSFFDGQWATIFAYGQT